MMIAKADPPTVWPGGLEDVEACPVCQEQNRFLLYGDLTDRVFHTAPGRWSLHGCAACGSAWLDPRPDLASIHLAYGTYYTHHTPAESGGGLARRIRSSVRDAYLDHELGYPSSGPNLGGRILYGALPWRARQVRAWVRDLPHPGKPARLLDIGAGSGAFVQQMNRMGWQAEGIEPDQAAVQAARSAGIPVTRATLDEYGHENVGAYDVVCMSHTIEHLHDPRTGVERCRALLRPGGLLWIATPNLAGRGHERFGADWLALDPPRHLVLFTHRSLTQLLRRAGFQDITWLPSSTSVSQMYRASVAIGRGEDPWTAPRTARSSAGASLLNLRMVSGVERGEEIIITARAPADDLP